MKFRQRKGHRLLISQIVFLDQFTENRCVVEDKIANEGNRRGRMVEALAKFSGEFHLMVHIVHPLSFKPIESLSDHSGIFKGCLFEFPGEEITILNTHSHSIGGIWRDRVNGIAHTDYTPR